MPHRTATTRWSGLALAVALLGGCHPPLSLAPTPAAPPPPTASAGASEFRPALIDTFLAQRFAALGGVGLSLAVVRDGKLELVRTYGLTSVESRQPVTDSTRFAVGSITKQFTATCVLLLAEEGRLSVTDKVSQYFPDLTRANEITLLDLLNHVSGYTDYYPLDFVDRRLATPTTADAVIREYAGGRLDFDPGTRWSYSNTGYLILGRVVEQVTGEPLGQFMQERLFGPLGMSHTVYEPAPGTLGLACRHTAFALGSPTLAPSEAAGWAGSAGALYSTAIDLATWDLALTQGQVLKPASYALMTQPRTLADGRTTGYGCGLFVSQQDGWTILEHGGAVSGSMANNLVVPGDRSAFVVLVNCEQWAIVDSVKALVLPWLAPKPQDNLPKVSGPPALEVAQAVFAELQMGRVDRSHLGDEFSYFLDEAKLCAAKALLGPNGKATQAEQVAAWERGGMEATLTKLDFRDGRTLRAVMYRTSDGLVQEFLIVR